MVLQHSGFTGHVVFIFFIFITVNFIEKRKKTTGKEKQTLEEQTRRLTTQEVKH